MSNVPGRGDQPTPVSTTDSAGNRPAADHHTSDISPSDTGPSDTDSSDTDSSDIGRPDPERWPGLATPPRSPLRARIAEQLFRRAVECIPVRVLLPGGERLGSGGADAPAMRIVRPRAFFHRLGADSNIGFGEAYLVGDWTSDRLADLLTPFAERMASLIPRWMQVFRRFVDVRHPVADEGTLAGAKSNIERHYDLSNDLFAAFLDPSMTYSSALFTGPDDTDLAAGQQRKIDAVLDYAAVGSGTKLLEIGTGWGELAIRAAQRGATVDTLTLSTEQRDLARQRIAAAGVSDRVRVLLRDYREASGSYDAIASVEMIEAVGERYWPAYFSSLDRLLRPGGRIGLQTITMPHERMLSSRNAYTWIHKYVFPGGLIPSLTAIRHQLAAHTGLRIAAYREFGQDYATTLRLWRERFSARRTEITALGFDATFRRMWEFYLAYSEAGFRAGYLGVAQVGLAR
jgi:cyclopropane-fatty-acyl-phospholipid synthase